MEVSVKRMLMPISIFPLGDMVKATSTQGQNCLPLTASIKGARENVKRFKKLLNDEIFRGALLQCRGMYGKAVVGVRRNDGQQSVQNFSLFSKLFGVGGVV